MNNNDQNKNFEELCAAYVLNALETEEQNEFEVMLAEASEEQRQLYQKMWSAANQLSFTIDGSEPSPDVKEKLMTRIKTESQGPEKDNEDLIIQDVKDPADNAAASEEEGFNWLSFTLAASFALLIICLSLILYSLNLNTQINQIEEKVAEQQETISDLQAEIQQKEELLSVLESRQAEIIFLSGMESNPDGYGKIIWNTESNDLLLQVSNMPVIQNDNAYQLWVIINNKYIPAGVFSVNSEGEGFFKIEEINNADLQSSEAFAVTLEPEGGSQQPTGDTYLMGNVNGD